MDIHRGLNDLPEFREAIVTSGTFDGVHLGHKKLLSRIKELCQSSGGETILLTFWPHPRMVLNKNRESLHLLTTLEERIELLNDEGIDHLVIVPFTKEFSETGSIDFIERILVKNLKTKTLVIGYNHRFGKNREGSFEELKEHSSQFGFEVHEISKEEVDHIAVSSTKIRNALLGSKIKEANSLLGRPYSFSGHVSRGRSIGKEIGFPTANIDGFGDHKLVPGSGVYAVEVIHEGIRYQGMMNIGHRPTFEDEGLKVEVHIFEFQKDIYGEKLKIEVIDHLREEQKFNDLGELKSQLEIDRNQAIKILNSSHDQ